ncbi:Glycosyltransferase involved in cell wall bisynthesis, partial [Candidatus Methanophagaceae archaeon]
FVEILNQAKAGPRLSIDDPKELAEKIVAILDDPEKGEKMGQNGRQYFLERFERKKITKKWANMLECWNDKDRGRKSEVGD